MFLYAGVILPQGGHPGPISHSGRQEGEETGVMEGRAPGRILRHRGKTGQRQGKGPEGRGGRPILLARERGTLMSEGRHWEGKEQNWASGLWEVHGSTSRAFQELCCSAVCPTIIRYNRHPPS